jgi:uncharacterized protein YbjT (DUF2867 family)
MFAITGITGKVGGATARALLDAGGQVRAVVRDKAGGGSWQSRGCEVAVADISDAAALAEALAGAGLFNLVRGVARHVSRADSQRLTWTRRPTSVIGGKADMARTCQYVR